MKKNFIFIILCIVLTGCSADITKDTLGDLDETKVEETTASTTDQEMEMVEEIPSLDDVDVVIDNQETPIAPIEIKNQILENTIEEDSVVLAHVQIEYPVIQNATEEEGLIKLNQYFAESAQALFEENNTYANDNVEMMKEEAVADNNSREYYNEYKVIYEVTYNKNGYLSIVQNFYEDDYSVAHPFSYSTGSLFDIKTGDQLVLSDILEGSKEELNDIITSAFMDSDSISTEIKNTYGEEIKANTEYVEFYLDDNNIYFFYNTNVVAPYEEGTLRVSLPIDTLKLQKSIYNAEN